MGDDTGALVIYAHPELDGRESEILPVHASGHDHPVHNVVRERRVGSRHVHAAVFPDLPAGRYALPYDSDIADRQVIDPVRRDHHGDRLALTSSLW